MYHEENTFTESYLFDSVHAFGITLRHSPGSFAIDMLIDIYTTSIVNKDILDDRSILVKIVNTYGLFDVCSPLTFQGVVEAANRACLGVGALDYYTSFRCAREHAKRDDMSILTYVMEEHCQKDYYTTNAEYEFDRLLCDAAERHNLEVLEYVIQKYIEYCDPSEPRNMSKEVMIGAAKGGHLDIIMATERSGEINSDIWKYVAYNAASKDHMSIEKYSGSKIDDISWEHVAICAAEGGHLEMFNYAIASEKGVIDWSNIFQPAAEGGNIEILDIVFTKCDSKVDWNSLAYGALVGGHSHLYDTATKNGANDWTMVALGAVKGENIDVLKFALTQNITFGDLFDRTVYETPENEEILRILLEYYDDVNMNRDDGEWLIAFHEVEKEYGNKEMMSLIKEWHLQGYEGL